MRLLGQLVEAKLAYTIYYSHHCFSSALVSEEVRINGGNSKGS